MSHYRWIWVLVVLVLGACVPVEDSNLYVLAESSDATSQAAAQRAIVLKGALTATAGAPIMEITQTAAAVSVYSTQISVMGTATAQAWTSTPQPTATITPSPTPNLTATLGISQLHAQETLIANDLQTSALALERQQRTNRFWAVALPVLYVVALALVILAFLDWRRAKRFRAAPVNAQGAAIPVIDLTTGTLTDASRNPNFQSEMYADLLRQILWAVARSRFQLPAPAPVVTSERQDMVTRQQQMVDMVARANGQGAATLAQQQVLAQVNRPQLVSVPLKVISADEAKALIGDILPALTRDAVEADVLEAGDEAA